MAENTFGEINIMFFSTFFTFSTSPYWIYEEKVIKSQDYLHKRWYINKSDNLPTKNQRAYSKK